MDEFIMDLLVGPAGMDDDEGARGVVMRSKPQGGMMPLDIPPNSKKIFHGDPFLTSLQNSSRI